MSLFIPSGGGLASILSNASLPPKVYKGVKGGVYYLIQTLPQFNNMVDELLRHRLIAIDTETSGLNWVFSDVCGISIGCGVAQNYYIPINHKTGEKQLSIEDIRPGLKKILENPDIAKIGHNLSFDMHGLRKLGIEVKGVLHDTMVLYHLLDENADHSLKETAKKFIDAHADKWETVIAEWRRNESKNRKLKFGHAKRLKVAELKENLLLEVWARQLVSDGYYKNITVPFNQVAESLIDDPNLTNYKLEHVTYDYIPLEVMAPYACADVHYTLALYKEFIIEISKEPNLQALYINEMRLLRVLFEAEHHGVKIDRQYLIDVKPRFEEEINKEVQKIHNKIGYEFNISSDQELARALQSQGVVLTKLTKGSQEKLELGEEVEARFSVDRGVLDKLATRYEIADDIIRYRELCKLKSTYVEGLLNILDKDDFVHSTFNPNVSSGRMSSRNPNCQNIPADNQAIRRAFIVPDDYHYFLIDYSQVELRLLAHFSQDPVMLSCYPKDGKGLDIHDVSCAEIIMGIPLEVMEAMKQDKTGHKVNSLEACVCPSCTVNSSRKLAKVLNFSISYGVGPTGLQSQISTPQKQYSLDECGGYIEKYLNTYHGVRNWLRCNKSDLRRCGFVQNAFGRYRRFPDIAKMERWRFEAAARIGNNFVIQSTAADLFKHAVTRIYSLLQGKKTKLVSFVHDEVQLYVHKSELDLIPQIVKCMEDFDFLVPIIADVSYSTHSWADKQKYTGTIQ